MKNLISIIIILCLTLSIMTPYAQAANSDVTLYKQQINMVMQVCRLHTNRRVLLM